MLRNHVVGDDNDNETNNLNTKAMITMLMIATQYPLASAVLLLGAAASPLGCGEPQPDGDGETREVRVREHSELCRVDDAPHAGR